MASLSFISSSRIRMSDEKAYVSFSRTTVDFNTTVTVTLSGFEIRKNNREEVRALPVAARVSAVSSPVMSSSSHASSSHSQDQRRKTIEVADSVLVKPLRLVSTSESEVYSINQEQCLIESIQNAKKQIPEELDTAMFVGMTKLAAQGYNKKRTLFFEKANATLEYVDEATLENIKEITVLAERLKKQYEKVFKLEAILLAMEQIPEKLDVNIFVGLARAEVEEHNRMRSAIVEAANAKLREMDNVIPEDVKAIVDRAKKLKDNQERILNLNKQQLSLLGEVSFSGDLIQAKSVIKEDGKEPMKSAEPIDDVTRVLP